jgi:hypothetical protein
MSGPHDHTHSISHTHVPQAMEWSNGTTTSFQNAIDRTMENYKNALSQQLYGTTPMLDHLTTKENNNMSIEDKIANERQEARERIRIEALYEQLETVITADLLAGTAVVWKEGETTQVAVKQGNDYWRTTFSSVFADHFGLVDELVRRRVATVEVR